MVTVPNIVAHAEHLRVNPIIMYVIDHFQKPYPFTPDVVIDIEPVIEQKFESIHRHTSQMYEWLPYNARRLEQVPEGKEERREWLRGSREPALLAVADRFRQLLISRYGPERGAQVRYAEAFEACEYGSPLTDEARQRLFPF
jgi:hypothetical protein